MTLTKVSKESLNKEFTGYSAVKEFFNNITEIGPNLSKALDAFRQLEEPDRFEEMEAWIETFEITHKEDKSAL